MPSSIFIIIFFILVFLGFTKQDSRPIAKILCLLAIVLMGLNTGNIDSENYELKYEWSENGIYPSIEIGFSLLCYLSNIAGLAFIDFKLILAVITYLLMYSSIKNYSAYISLVFATYMLCYFPLDVTQFRNFFAFSIIIYAITHFLFVPTKKNAFLYIVMVLISSSIHISCIYYLSFILARKPISKKLLAALFIGAVLIESSVYLFFSNKLGSNEIEGYQGQISMLSAIIFSAIQIFNAIFIRKIYKSNGLKEGHNDKNDLFAEYMYRINVLLLLLIPFIFDDATYTRIFRMVSILNLVFISNCMRMSSKKSQVLLMYFLYALYFGIMYIFLDSNASRIIYPVFHNNLLIR